jgi:hypothetical protein
LRGDGGSWRQTARAARRARARADGASWGGGRSRLQGVRPLGVQVGAAAAAKTASGRSPDLMGRGLSGGGSPDGLLGHVWEAEAGAR